VSWSSKKQPIVTLSTTEAEYVAAAAACACQCIWMRSVLEHLQVKQGEGTVILCDNSSSIKLSKNPVMHGRCKHIDVRFHFLRNLVKDGIVELRHCKSEDQIADLMTKPLKLEAFCKLIFFLKYSNNGMKDLFYFALFHSTILYSAPFNFTLFRSASFHCISPIQT
jgi:hypothetical protein